ncbi:hypothetical protein [Amycolatopsis jejuensis]|uniref:hypothetical protein n=1 Tax=Amycolatopsis jejuensis TaxID=330084 RepID=UPI000526872D|nr:hypothetical protein [Amycolatopsis jejuensis]
MSDDLEQQLRALLADDRFAVEPADDAASAIVAGAQRRRRRQRVLTSAAGAVCVLAVASAGLVVIQLRTEDGAADLSVGQVTPSETTSAAVPGSPSVPEPTRVPVPVQPPGTGEIHQTVPPSRPHHSKPTAPSTTPSKVASGSLVTADGLGAVKLGMTKEQLTEKGVTLTPVKESAGCTYYGVGGAGVPAGTAVVSPDNGVVAVKPDGAAHTPEGVGDGSSKDQVTATYPGTSESSSGLVSPTGDQGTYHFTLDSAGEVQSVEVRAKKPDC